MGGSLNKKRVMSTSADSAASTAPPEEVLKLRPRCLEGEQCKPLDAFHNDENSREGNSFYCKPCTNFHNRMYKLKRRRGDDDGDEEGEGDNGEEGATRGTFM